MLHIITYVPMILLVVSILFTAVPVQLRFGDTDVGSADYRGNDRIADHRRSDHLGAEDPEGISAGLIAEM